MKSFIIVVLLLMFVLDGFGIPLSSANLPVVFLDPGNPLNYRVDISLFGDCENGSIELSFESEATNISWIHSEYTYPINVYSDGINACRSISLKYPYAYVGGATPFNMKIFDISEVSNIFNTGYLDGRDVTKSSQVDKNHDFVAIVYDLGMKARWVNVTDPKNPSLYMSEFGDGEVDNIYDVSTQFPLMFLTNYAGGLFVVNFTNSTHSEICDSSVSVQGSLQSFHYGDYLFVCDSQEGVKIFDVSNPCSVNEIKIIFDALHYFKSVYYQPETELLFTLAAGSGNKLIIYDITTKTNPIELSLLNIDVTASSSLDVDSGYAVVSCYGVGYNIINVVDKNEPVLFKRVTTSIKQTYEIRIRGNYLYYCDETEKGFRVDRFGDLMIKGTPNEKNESYCGNHTLVVKAQRTLNPEEFVYANVTVVMTGKCEENYECVNHFCECKFGYEKENCSDWKCFGIYKNDSSNVCSNRGVCEGYDQCKCSPGILNPLPNCSCVPASYGYNCTTFECYGINSLNQSLVCSGHGKCAGLNKCVCNENYYGSICNITTCNSVFSNDTDLSGIRLCNGHGNCFIHDFCECVSTNYTGDDCQNWYCYDEENDDYNDVCTGRGDCIDVDVCNCTEEYYGSECLYFSCFSADKRELDEVCYGHGVCNDHDTCECLRGYGSEEIGGICNIWDCGTEDRESVNVCNQHGKCKKLHDCECDEGYKNQLCDSWECSGEDKESVNVCSGKGECKGPSNCKCNRGRSGKSCQTNIYLLTIMTPILGVSGFTVFCIIISCLVCICCCVCVCLCSLVLLLCVSGIFLLAQKVRIKRFGRLKNFDMLIKEQEMDEDMSMAHIKIKKDFFKINYDELKIKKTLGEGGSSSVVFLAVWKGREVAFKCFKTRTLCQSQDTFDEFEREVDVLGSVSHPSILRFFGCSLNPPRVGIVMEYCSNGDLSFFLGEYRDKHGGKRYPFSSKVRILDEIISALDYLHIRNIIHRDIKLENVLLDAQESAKLMDFGLSRHVERMSQTKTMRIGTDVYMAPELISDASYDEKCDVYSFSILIYIFLTENFQPYSGVANVELRVANNPNFRPNIKELEEWIPHKSHLWISEVVQKCWNQDPSQRYSFSELSKMFQSNKKMIMTRETEKVEEENNNELRSVVEEKVGGRKRNLHDDDDDVLERRSGYDILEMPKSLEEATRIISKANVMIRKANETISHLRDKCVKNNIPLDDL